jgi:hypothetical protein
MPYYVGGDCMYGRGDYYQGGDYYRGDPGLLGAIGRVAGGLVRKVAGSRVGQTVAGVVRRVAGGGGGETPMTGPPGLAPLAPPPPPILRQITPGPGTAPPVPTVPGFPFPTPGAGVGTVMSPMGTIAECPKGYHVNKTLVRAYAQFRNRGTITPGMQRAMAQMVNVCVRSRRMDVANTRALRRSIKRFKGFAKLARRVITFTTARAPKGKARAKGRR